MKAKFYEIEFSKKHKAWIAKYRTSTYKYLKVPKSPSFENIESAEKWIKDNYEQKTKYDRPCIDHKIGRFHGHLMTLEDWKEDCNSGGFIDYDGHGNLIDENYNFVESPDNGNDFFKYSICPSDYTENRYEIPSNVKYILWYNR